MINKVKINPIDRINRIAMTGDIEDPKPLSPVENIMQHYPKTQETPQEEGGFWNGLKNFAGSKGGRMLIGGLGTAAAVGLTGGGLQNALGYGVIGAGKTAENIYNQEQDQKAWEEKEAERLFRQQESIDNRKFQAQMKMAEIEANKQARADEFEKIKEELKLKDQYGAFDKKGKTPAEQVEAFAKAGATPEAVSKFAESLGLVGYEFKDTKPKLTGQTQLLDYMVNVLGVEPSEAISRIARMTPDEQLALHQGKVAINTDGKLVIVDAQHQNAMAKQDDAQEHDVDMAGVKFGYDSKLQSQKAKADEEKAKRDFERALAKSDYDNELKKDFEEYKTTLPLPEILEYEQRAKALQKEGLNYTVGDLILEDYLNDVASRNKTLSQTNLNNANAGFISGAKTNLTNAQTGLTNARTGLTEAQTGQVGKTSGINNAEWLANNPNATMEQKIALGISGSYGKAYNDAIMTGKTTEEANKIAMAKVQQDIITGQLMSGMLGGGMPSGQPPVYPQESTEDVEYVTF